MIKHVPLKSKRFYNVEEPAKGWRSEESFDAAESQKLRPIAETLAMLEGNAFFNQGDQFWYRQYLPEAHALWEANGGDAGWAGQSWIGRMNHHETEAVKAAHDEWIMLKQLVRESGS